MPGFDRTGPLGEGEMTGRGEGYCMVEADELGRTGTGLRRLAGFRRGLGLGRGRWLPGQRRYLGLGYRRGRGRRL